MDGGKYRVQGVRLKVKGAGRKGSFVGLLSSAICSLSFDIWLRIEGCFLRGRRMCI
jgi:hypothetical protein